MDTCSVLLYLFINLDPLTIWYNKFFFFFLSIDTTFVFALINNNVNKKECGRQENFSNSRMSIETCPKLRKGSR